MHESKVLQCFRSRPNHRSKQHPLHSTGVFKDVNRKGRITVKAMPGSFSVLLGIELRSLCVQGKHFSD